MKILYISSLMFKKGSSASIRNTGLIKGIIENGHKVDILTVDYPEKMIDSNLENILKKECNIKKIQLKILGKYLALVEKKEIKKSNILLFLKKIIKDLYFFPDVDKEWIKNIKSEEYFGYDLIISSSDTKTSHYIAKKILKKNKTCWYQIWGDPWANDIGISKIKKLYIKYLEKKIISKADCIFYVSPLTMEEMKESNKSLQDKIKYLPRGYLEPIKKMKKDEKEDILKIVYTGVLNKYRNIEPLLEIIELYNDKNKNKIEFHIYGNMDSSSNVLKYKFVKYFGVVSIEKIKKIYEYADILIFLGNKGKTTQIPGKIYDYLGTECKILALFEEKNNIYKYFKENFDIDTFIEKDFKIDDLDKIIKKENRQIDKRYLNKNIATKILEKSNKY